MKKIQILRDAKGKILAVSQLALPEEVPVSLKAGRGQKLVEMNAKAKYVAMSAASLIKQLQVDVRTTASQIKIGKIKTGK